MLSASSACWLTSSLDDARAVAPSGDAAKDAVGDGTATATRCPSTGALACDDFEHDAGFDKALWPTPGNDQHEATLLVDSARQHGGRYSLQARALPTPDATTRAEGFLIHQEPAPWPASFYGRVFLYVPSDRPANPWRPEILGFQGASGKGFGFSLVDGFLGANIYSQTPNVGEVAATPFPVDRWVCVTWSIVGAGEPTSTVEAFVDGQRALAVTTTVGLPALLELYLGIRFDAAVRSTASTVWFDDLALATGPIRCAD